MIGDFFAMSGREVVEFARETRGDSIKIASDLWGVAPFRYWPGVARVR
jgi:hypothetical protein